jgi:hypothetical protein
MSNASGLSRGDRNRNAKLVALRELVPLTNAMDGHPGKRYAHGIRVVQ